MTKTQKTLQTDGIIKVALLHAALEMSSKRNSAFSDDMANRNTSPWGNPLKHSM